MRVLLFISLIAHVASCFSQNKVAVVTTKKNETAYYNLQKGITYVESTDPVINEAICKYNNGFARIRRSNKFYFTDEFGKPVFPVAYEKAEDFSEGLARVKIDGKWGFINKKGEIQIKPQFYEAHPFSCGLSQVAFGPKEKHGYIDSTGNFVIKPQFDNSSSFINDRAWVSQGGKWGLINRAGEFIFAPTYKDVKNVYEHYNLFAAEYTYDYLMGIFTENTNKNSDFVWTSLNEKWGLVNKNGKIMIGHAFTEVKDVCEGYTWVKQGELWGLIDSAGNYLVKPNERNPLIYGSNVSLKAFSDFHNGLIRYQSKGLYGYMDHHLTIVVPAKFDKATDFKNGMACVRQEGYCGLVDTKGKLVIPINYKEIIISNDDLFPARDDNGDWGYLNLKNEWVVKPQFKNASPFAITNYN